jgi:hypothetical protein
VLINKEEVDLIKKEKIQNLIKFIEPKKANNAVQRLRFGDVASMIPCPYH